MDINEIKGVLETHEKALGEKFDRYEAELKATGEVSKGVKADLKSMAEDHDGVKKQLAKMGDSLLSIEQRGVKADERQARTSMGSQFVNSDAFKSFKAGETSKAKMEIKNTILGETTSNPTNDIVPLDTMGGIVSGATRALRVMDVVRRGMTTSNQVHYTRELAFTNSAAEAAEGAARAESALTFEPVDTAVRTISHFIKVSKQVLDDAPALQSYIDTRMRYGLDLRREQQIVAGNGTAPNLKGMTHTDNSTLLAATTLDLTAFDTANRAKYAIIGADYSPDYFLMNPADFGTLERSKTSTNAYVGGEGAFGYLNDGLVPTLWGLPVIMSNSVPAGTLLASSLDSSMWWDRQAATVEIFDQNDTDVQNGLLTVRAEERGAFTVFAPASVIRAVI